MRDVAVKEWIQKTKVELRQIEREKEIKIWFRIVFGSEPERISWTEEGKVKAVAKFENLDEYIKNKLVWSVMFLLEENDGLGGVVVVDDEWNFEEVEEEKRILYIWSKQIGKYSAKVEILSIK